MQTKENLTNALNELVLRFKNGTVGPMIHKMCFEVKDVPSRKWSLNNRLIMFFQGTMDARGMKQWNAVGRKVNKGAKAVWILGPRIIKEKVDDGNGQVSEVETLIGFTSIPVYRYEDTTGEPLAETPEASRKTLPLFEVAEKLGVDVAYDAAESCCYGSYAPTERSIRLHTDSLGTWLHELAHAVHHCAGYSVANDHDGSKYAMGEVVAETVAAVLFQELGLGDYSGNAYQYLARYAEILKLDVYKAVMKALKEIEKTINEIVELSGEDNGLQAA